MTNAPVVNFHPQSKFTDTDSQIEIIMAFRDWYDEDERVASIFDFYKPTFGIAYGVYYNYSILTDKGVDWVNSLFIDILKSFDLADDKPYTSLYDLDGVDREP